MKLLFRTAWLAALLGTCFPSPASGAPIPVVVSILPQADLVQRLGGPRLSVVALVPPGRSPELFEPTPQQVAHLSRSRLYVRVGLPFEERVLAFAAAQCPNLVVHDLRGGLSLLPMEADAHLAGASDPHVWLDPRRMTTAAQRLAEALIRLDPEGKADYERNLAALCAQLKQADAAVHERLAGFAGRRFYVFHPAFGYFADAYGLVQVAVETGGKEPSARQLAQLIQRARADGARTLFVQPQFPQKSVETLAAAIGAKTVVLDDLPSDLLANYLDLADKTRAALMETNP